MEGSEELLFAYGALRYNFEMNIMFLGLHRLVTPAILRGYQIYDLGEYPVAIETGDSKDLVYGEVYLVPGQILRAIDYVEREFTRKMVNVEVAPIWKAGSSIYIKAWTYVWARDRERLERIALPVEGGDYSRMKGVPRVALLFIYGGMLEAAAGLIGSSASNRVRDAIVAVAPSIARGYRLVYSSECRGSLCESLRSDGAGSVPGAVYYVDTSRLREIFSTLLGTVKEPDGAVVEASIATTGRKVYAYAPTPLSGDKEKDCGLAARVARGLMLHGLLEEAWEAVCKWG